MKCILCGKKSNTKDLCFHCASLVGQDYVFVEKKFFSLHKRFLLLKPEAAENLFNILGEVNRSTNTMTEEEITESTKKHLEEKITFLDPVQFKNLMKMFDSEPEKIYI
jgi:hypothetical protein